jgi:hypothetical protein
MQSGAEDADETTMMCHHASAALSTLHAAAPSCRQACYTYNSHATGHAVNDAIQLMAQLSDERHNRPRWLRHSPVDAAVNVEHLHPQDDCQACCLQAAPSQYSEPVTACAACTFRSSKLPCNVSATMQASAPAAAAAEACGLCCWRCCRWLNSLRSPTCMQDNAHATSKSLGQTCSAHTG